MAGIEVRVIPPIYTNQSHPLHFLQRWLVFRLSIGLPSKESHNAFLDRRYRWSLLETECQPHRSRPLLLPRVPHIAQGIPRSPNARRGWTRFRVHERPSSSSKGLD